MDFARNTLARLFPSGNPGNRAAFMQGRPAIAPSHPSPEETMMKTFRLMLGAAVAVAGLAIASAADAAPAGVKVGDLTCNVSSGFGFIFGSSKDLHCTYRPSGHPREHYVGTINKFGVDIGYTEGGVLIWGVFAPTSDVGPGALSGTYAGGTASATV